MPVFSSADLNELSFSIFLFGLVNDIIVIHITDHLKTFTDLIRFRDAVFENLHKQDHLSIFFRTKYNILKICMAAFMDCAILSSELSEK